MPRDEMLLELMSQSRIVDADDVRALRAVAAGEPLLDHLVTCGVLAPTSGRTLDLIRKKFLAPADASVLMPHDGVARLRDLLAAHRSAAGPARPPSSGRATKPDLAGMTQPTVNLPGTRGGPSASVAEPPPGPGPEPVVRVGATLGKCLLTGQLGKGGYGVVYSALHQTLGIPVAVKVLLGGGGAADPEKVRQLRDEAQLLARLNHPHVVRVLDFDDRPVPHVVMEHVEGLSLAEVIASTGGLWAGRAVAVFSQVAMGLRAAWEVGVVHRDVKPGNILMTRAGDAKVADLGLATGPASTPAAGGGTPVGTSAYMAPEQARSAHAVDFRADVYALGATMYHAVTGELPFDARSAGQMLLRHATEPLVPACVRAPARVTEALSRVIGRMMEKDPATRYDSYDDLLAALAAAGSGPEPGGPAAAETESAVVPARKTSLIRNLFRRREGT